MVIIDNYLNATNHQLIW